MLEISIEGCRRAQASSDSFRFPGNASYRDGKRGYVRSARAGYTDSHAYTNNDAYVNHNSNTDGDTNVRTYLHDDGNSNLLPNLYAHSDSNDHLDADHYQYSDDNSYEHALPLLLYCYSNLHRDHNAYLHDDGNSHLLPDLHGYSDADHHCNPDGNRYRYALSVVLYSNANIYFHAHANCHQYSF